jgi:mono/diheme cytochrome c family protein
MTRAGGRALAVAGPLALVACGAGPHTRAAGAVAVTPLAVRSADWNPRGTPVGEVRAVADAGNVAAVFGPSGAALFSAGALVATDHTVGDWIGGSEIAGADGSTRWIVGFDGKGRLYYLRGSTSFEDVSARYGLDGRPVRGVARIDSRHAGFLLDHEIALADGRSVTRYGTPPLTELVGGDGWAVGVARDVLLVFDPAHPSAKTYAVRGIIGAAVDRRGRVYASTSRALYATAPNGQLDLIYDAQGKTLHGLVASGDQIWFADGSELGVIDGGKVAETRGAHVAADAKLASSSSGDVWVLSGSTLQRFARLAPGPERSSSWTGVLAPIFGRSCSACHQPDGVSGTDLSTAEAWESERDAIRARVVVSKTMPPQGHPLSESDRDAIGAWAAARR